MLIRCDVGSEIGWGHFNRCIILGKELCRYFEITFVVRSNQPEKIKNLLKGLFNHVIIPNHLELIDEIKYYPKDQNFIVLDISHIKNLRKTHELKRYFNSVLHYGIQIIYIDGDGDELLKTTDNPLFLAYIQPYMSVSAYPTIKTRFYLSGLDYLLVNPIYFVPKVSKKDQLVKNFLITFGGSDPQWITKDVLEGISSTKHQSKFFKIVVGPSFSSQLITLLEERSKKYKNIELVYAPENLLYLYKWAHLCIGASSTTRFEAAVCGIPMIFVALYPEQEVLSINYEKLGFAKYLGLYKQLLPKHWATIISAYYSNNAIYSKMASELDRQSFIGLGPQNLANKINEICKGYLNER